MKDAELRQIIVDRIVAGLTGKMKAALMLLPSDGSKIHLIGKEHPAALSLASTRTIIKGVTASLAWNRPVKFVNGNWQYVCRLEPLGVIVRARLGDSK